MIDWKAPSWAKKYSKGAEWGACIRFNISKIHPNLSNLCFKVIIIAMIGREKIHANTIEMLIILNAWKKSKSISKIHMTILMLLILFGGSLFTWRKMT